MRTVTRSKIGAYFERSATPIFWPSDLSKILGDHRKEWDAFDLSAPHMLKFLLEDGALFRAEFKSQQYPSILRYLRGNPSPYELALSLRRNSFLCHKTALMVHGLEPPNTSMLYVNQEQGLKPAPEGITQETIKLAFRNQQRRSRYLFRFRGSQFVLISGKNTRRAGVIRKKAPDGAVVSVSDLERTLIDIVVRPAYSGGLHGVVAAYGKAVSDLNIHHLIELLRGFDYGYPYQQAIGFLLERAGRPQKDCEKLRDLGLEFDFYLDYGIKRPAYDAKWRLYYPSFLA